MEIWNYNKAFSRNLGLISPAEQEKIRRTRIAIAGMGGVGGVHLITLLRQGFEKFNLADFDTFDWSNFNRQYGAEILSVGKKKLDWMAQVAKRINPNVDLNLFAEPINEKNAEPFLKDCDVLVDGIDAFAVAARRAVFMYAHQHNKYVVTAAPMGFSTSWLTFSPQGMDFDSYFGIRDHQTQEEMFIRFMLGLSPRALHFPYMDLSYVNFKEHRGPSSMIACQLCSGVLSAEVIKIVTGKGQVRVAPYYQQFDAFRSCLKKGRMIGGSKNPLFKLKLFISKIKLKQILSKD